MFKEMRRKKQLLSQAESEALLLRGSSGVLALEGENGYPYAVPLSYVYHEGKLYFHSARVGQKIDAIRYCDKASFCVIAQDDVVPDKYTTYYKSVIAFGHIRLLENTADILGALQALAEKYHPTGSLQSKDAEIENGLPRLCMIELSIEHMTGKAARELTEPCQ